MSPLKVHRATEDRTWWASLSHRIAGSQSQLNDMQHTQSSLRAIPTFSPSLYTCSHNKFPSIKKKKKSSWLFTNTIHVVLLHTSSPFFLLFPYVLLLEIKNQICSLQSLDHKTYFESPDIVLPLS